MNAREAIKLNIDMSQLCCNMYLDDLTDEDLMRRPHPDCNHINWQIGHLIESDHRMIQMIAPGSMPELPAGFAEKYTKATAVSDNPADFCSKAQLLEAAAIQLKGLVKALFAMSDDDLDKPSPEPLQAYAPTYGALFSMLGSHWMMHSGQWVVVRRQLGKPPLF